MIPSQPSKPLNHDEAATAILSMRDPRKRVEAASRLWASRHALPDLALYVWYSQATVAVILSDVLEASRRFVVARPHATYGVTIAPVLQLMELCAEHPDTRRPFIEANIPCYFMPFLHAARLDQSDPLPILAIRVIAKLVGRDDEGIELATTLDVIPVALKLLRATTPLRTGAALVLCRIAVTAKGSAALSRPEVARVAFAELNRATLTFTWSQADPIFSQWLIRAFNCILDIPGVAAVARESARRGEAGEQDGVRLEELFASSADTALLALVNRLRALKGER